jgi:septum formation protein
MTNVWVAFVHKGEVVKKENVISKTEVTFSDLTAEEIDAYVESGEPFGKAGGYGIQGLGCTLISKLEGCYFNVMGFPI